MARSLRLNIKEAGEIGLNEPLAEAARIDRPIGAPLEGGRLEATTKGLAAGVTPDIVAAYRRLASGKQ